MGNRTPQKITAVLLLCLLVIFSLSSCLSPADDVIIIGTTADVTTGTQSNSSVTGTITTQKENSDPTASSESALPSQTPDTDIENRLMVVNESTKKIHLDGGCVYAGKIKEENRAEYERSELEALLEQGYSLCSYCGK